MAINSGQTFSHISNPVYRSLLTVGYVIRIELFDYTTPTIYFFENS